MRISILLLYVSLLAACSSPIKQHISHFNNTKSCCSDFSDISYEEATIPSVKKTTLNLTDNVISIPNGKSYYKAYELPTSNNGYYIDVISETVGDYYPSSYWFYPRITLLDKNYKLVTTQEPKLLLRDNGTTFSPYTVILENFLKIEANSPIKYVVIHTEPDDFNYGIAITTVSGGAYTIGGSPVILPAEKFDTVAGFSPIGNIKFSIFHEWSEIPDRGKRIRAWNATLVKLKSE